MESLMFGKKLLGFPSLKQQQSLSLQRKFGVVKAYSDEGQRIFKENDISLTISVPELLQTDPGFLNYSKMAVSVKGGKLELVIPKLSSSLRSFIRDDEVYGGEKNDRKLSSSYNVMYIAELIKSLKEFAMGYDVEGVVMLSGGDDDQRQKLISHMFYIWGEPSVMSDRVMNMESIKDLQVLTKRKLMIIGFNNEDMSFEDSLQTFKDEKVSNLICVRVLKDRDLPARMYIDENFILIDIPESRLLDVICP